MIYFVRRPSDGSIKIGTSIHVEKRLKELIYEYREELSVLAVAEGSYDEEAAYHDRFRHLHVEDEWFGPGEDLLAFVATECQPWLHESPRLDRAFARSLTGGRKRQPTRYAVVHAPEYRAWMDGFLEFLDSSSITDVFREAIRRHALARGFREPPPF